MAISNPVFDKLVNAISPVVSIGVGSAICSVCSKNGIRPEDLKESDLASLKPALLEHYTQFWSQKMDDIKQAVGAV